MFRKSIKRVVGALVFVGLMVLPAWAAPEFPFKDVKSVKGIMNLDEGRCQDGTTFVVVDTSSGWTIYGGTKRFVAIYIGPDNTRVETIVAGTVGEAAPFTLTVVKTIPLEQSHGNACDDWLMDVTT